MGLSTHLADKSPDGMLFPPSIGDFGSIKKLSSLDWDFKGEKTNTATHWYHPYPARFIPQIPRRLIAAFTAPHDTVYDPFVGSGTVCVEANLAGRHAIGNDINPLSVLMAKVKTHPLTCGKDVLSAFKRTINNRAVAGDTAVIPDMVASAWFEDFALREIAIIHEEILSLKKPHLRDFCLIALSAIIVNVSKQDSDTRYTRVGKKIAPLDVSARYIRHLERMLATMQEWSGEIAGGQTTVRIGNSKNMGIFGDHSADFAVTSPPYPNAYDYHLYHKHRMLWLGFDPAEVKKNEIGAHAHYSRPNGMTANDFRRDMDGVFASVLRVLKPGKYYAVVIGNSIIRGERVDNSVILRDAAHDSGFKLSAEFSRNLDSSKKSFHPSHGNIASEKIMVFRSQA